MKILRYVAYVLAAIGAVSIICACIDFIFHVRIGGFAHPIGFFHAANSFLLLSVAILIACKQCCCDSCNCKEEKKEG